MTSVEHFDSALRRLTQDRGAIYGHPADDFRRAQALQAVIAECPHPLVRHALNMIAVKIARLIQTPDHQDSIEDIAGYARTIAMILDRERVADPSGIDFSFKPPPHPLAGDPIEILTFCQPSVATE